MHMEKSYKNIRLFDNPFLERLTHVHPITPLIVWTPIISWMMWRMFIVNELSPYLIGMLGTMGFMSWTLAEYGLHRFLFHYESENPVIQRMHFLIHGLHHEEPNDPTRLVMPPVVSLFLGVVFYFLFRSLMQPEWVDPFFSFFVIGYLCYDYIHFAVHHFKPRTPVGKYLKFSHMQHHYVNPNTRWGVSSPFWDYIFGTLEDSRVTRVNSYRKN